MPELPEVETVRRGLAPAMEGSRIERLQLNRADLRFPFPEDLASIVQDQTIVSVGRRAKYLLIDLDGGELLIMHLGMSGSFRIANQDAHGNFHHTRGKIEAHDHVIFHLVAANGALVQIIYNDPRRFGFLLLGSRSDIDDHPMIRNLGVEPIGNQFDVQNFTAKITGRNTPLKNALLDQSVVAGLGNIYVCEALWRSGLSPRRKARTIVLKSGKPTHRATLLVQNIKDVIFDAIEAGGSSLRDHTQTDGSMGYFQHSFAVYDQEGQPCRKPECDGTISRIVQSGRGTFYCPRCQK
ncbi:MAG: bifunctional DNA-formamidopyrimidine glycosylase/DNA-(apurinic or apyrimidinic site) lyase [Rhizobiaceae bacterium]